MSSRSADRIVLAYAGGLQTTVAIRWFTERHDVEVVTLTLDVGQGAELAGIRDRALASGAARAHVLDVREEFARRFVLPALQAGVVDRDGCPFVSSLAVPILAERLVQIAEIEKTTTIVYGTDARRGGPPLETAVARLDARLDVRALGRELGMSPRQQRAFATVRQLPLSALEHDQVAIRSNLWGRTIEWRVQADEPAVPSRSHLLTRPSAEWPDEPALIELTFERGVPTAINDVAMPLLELAASLGALGGAHGVGRSPAERGRSTRRGLQRIVEAPAAVLLHAAHRELQRRTTGRAAEAFGRLVSAQYLTLIEEAEWFSPFRQALDGYVDRLQPLVTGVVRLRLFRGHFDIVDVAHAASGPVPRGPLAPALIRPLSAHPSPTSSAPVSPPAPRAAAPAGSLRSLRA